MSDTLTEIVEQFECVSEISSDAVGGLVPLDPTVVAEVTEGDDDPRFATFVIDSGWSKSRRYWGPELFTLVAEQINDESEAIVGYQGHIKPEDHGHVFPDIQLQWLKAKVIQQGQNAKLAVKAYVLPGTKARQYMARKRPLVKTVSWAGKALEIPFERGVRVSNFRIESIDLSRPRAAGMSAQLVGGLTSEMEGSNSVKPEDIAALTPSDLRAHNPNLVTTLETEARKPVETRVSEMETTVGERDNTLAEIRKALGIPEDADMLETVRAMASSLSVAAKSVRDALLGDVISKKFKDAATAKLVKAALVSEMQALDVKGTEDSKTDDEKLVSEMVNGFIDRDDDLKKLVSEMEQTPGSPPSTNQDNRQDRELKAGMVTSNLRVKAVR
jgi:hypothetical protein